MTHPRQPAHPEPQPSPPALRLFQAGGLRVQHLAFPGMPSQRRSTSKCPSPEGLSTLWLASAPSCCPDACFPCVCLCGFCAEGVSSPGKPSQHSSSRKPSLPDSPPACNGLSCWKVSHPGLPRAHPRQPQVVGTRALKEETSPKPSSSSTWWGHSPPSPPPSPDCCLSAWWDSGSSGLAGSLVPGLAQCRCALRVSVGGDRQMGGRGGSGWRRGVSGAPRGLCVVQTEHTPPYLLCPRPCFVQLPSVSFCQLWERSINSGARPLPAPAPHSLQILVPQQGIKPRPPAVGARSSHALGHRAPPTQTPLFLWGN